jgi:hypothetical protein
VPSNYQFSEIIDIIIPFSTLCAMRHALYALRHALCAMLFVISSGKRSNTLFE